ncbi:MAG: MBL fold metallo-hydrolase [Pedosphaera sp.]|nr:MBL fold metallo-hydrolase [Pedosphaera sp.]
MKAFLRPAQSLAIATLLLAPLARAEVNVVEKVAPNVYFHEGDIGRHGHCNNGWIVFADYVLIIDANFPSGAQVVLPKIKALTDKPIRFVFDTHHHGDHAYGNQVMHEAGAIIVGHSGVLAEMKKYETNLFGGGKPGRWEDAAKGRKDVAASKLRPPSLLFEKQLTFDDGTHRVELLHLGVAHTYGDGWAWLPKERIVFTGDACVNGPYNYIGDGNIHEWIKTLDKVIALKPLKVCPAHGPSGGPEVLVNQQLYFKSLLAEVKKLKDAGKTAAEVQTASDTIKEALRKNEKIAHYIGQFINAQVEKAWTEMGGAAFPAKKQAQVDPVRLKAGQLLVVSDNLLPSR